MRKVIVSLILLAGILTAFSGAFSSFAENAAPFAENPLAGKKVLFCGDSITAAIIHNNNSNRPVEERGLPAIIGKENDLALWTNIGKNGASISDYMGANLIYNQLVYAATTGIDYDYVIISGGTNDAWYNVDIGEVSDSFEPEDIDRNTFAGGMEYTLFTARKLFPKADIGFYINFKHNSINEGNYKRLTNFEEMKKQYAVAAEACEKWDIPCLDLYNNDKLTLELEADVPAEKRAEAGRAPTNPYLPDIIHPSTDGYEVIAPYVVEWMKNDVTGSAAGAPPSLGGSDSSGELSPTNAKVYVSETVGKGGETVKITVTLKNKIAKLTSGALKISYDKTALKLENARWKLQNTLVEDFSLEDGLGVFAMNEPSPAVGALLELEFLILDEVSTNKLSKVSVECKFKEREESSDVSVTAEDGGVTLKNCAHASIDTVPAKEPSCTKMGKTEEKICKDCQKTISGGELVPALGHSFENNVCTVCGTLEKEPEPTPTPVTPTPTPDTTPNITPDMTPDMTTDTTPDTTPDITSGETSEGTEAPDSTTPAESTDTPVDTQVPDGEKGNDSTVLAIVVFSVAGAIVIGAVVFEVFRRRSAK